MTATIQTIASVFAILLFVAILTLIISGLVFLTTLIIIGIKKMIKRSKAS